MPKQLIGLKYKFQAYFVCVNLYNNDGTRDVHQSLEQSTLPIQTILQQLKYYVPDAKWSLEISDEKMLE